MNPMIKYYNNVNMSLKMEVILMSKLYNVY